MSTFVRENLGPTIDRTDTIRDFCIAAEDSKVQSLGLELGRLHAILVTALEKTADADTRLDERASDGADDLSSCLFGMIYALDQCQEILLTGIRDSEDVAMTDTSPDENEARFTSIFETLSLLATRFNAILEPSPASEWSKIQTELEELWEEVQAGKKSPWVLRLANTIDEYYWEELVAELESRGFQASQLGTFKIQIQEFLKTLIGDQILTISSSMKLVKIRTPADIQRLTGKTFRFHISENDSTKHLMNLMYNATGETWRLIYSGKELKAEKSISNYTIANGATLHAVMQLTSDAHNAQIHKHTETREIAIPVRIPGGSHSVVKVTEPVSVTDLKDAIELVTGVIPKNQRLRLEGKVLKYPQSLYIVELTQQSPVNVDFLSDLRYRIQVLRQGKKDPLIFDVDKDDSVLQIKRLIEKNTHLPADEQILSFQGNSLEDSSILSDCLIDPGSTIVMEEKENLRAERRVPIFIHLTNYTNYTPSLAIQSAWFLIKLSDRLSGLKSQIEERMSLISELQLLYFDNELLEGDRELRNYQLTSGASLELRYYGGVSETPNSATRLKSEYVEKSQKDEIMAESSQEFTVNPLHLLPGQKEILFSGHWKDILPLMPKWLRWDTEFTSDPNSLCWTTTPSWTDTTTSIPLTIAGAPVIVPVHFRYPIMGPVAPPPDPYPHPISPRAPILIETVISVFETFPQATGFFLLLNKMLQILVPANFDYEWASSHQPNNFGGLRVCYIKSSITPTADNQRTAIPVSASSASGSSQSGRRSFQPHQLTRPSTTVSASGVPFGATVEARVKDFKSKEIYTGKIGLKTMFQFRIYLTVSSHVATSAIYAKETQSFLSRFRGNLQVNLNTSWASKIEFWTQDYKVGDIVETFDSDAKEYPTGFKHDVSLVMPVNPALFTNFKSPVSGLGWLSQEGWNRLRQRPEALKIVGSTQNAVKTMATTTESQCMIVGEGIFRNQVETAPGKERNPEFWAQIVSRCVLYRVSPDFATPGGQSGMALYAEGKREDGTTGPGVVGFQSFVQRSGHVQSFETEGKHLEYRVNQGRVAFYGAFQVPQKLRTDHVIL